MVRFINSEGLLDPRLLEEVGDLDLSLMVKINETDHALVRVKSFKELL